MMLRKHHHQRSSWRVRADELYTQFKQWLEDNDAHTRCDITAIKFGFKIAKLVWNDAKRTGFKGIVKQRAASGMVYTIDIQSVVQEMVTRKWINPGEMDDEDDDEDAA